MDWNAGKLADDSVGRVILVQALVLTASVVATVSMALNGEWLAVVGFATASFATLSAITAAERWRTWRLFAERWERLVRGELPDDAPEP